MGWNNLYDGIIDIHIIAKSVNIQGDSVLTIDVGIRNNRIAAPVGFYTLVVFYRNIFCARNSDQNIGVTQRLAERNACGMRHNAP